MVSELARQFALNSDELQLLLFFQDELLERDIASESQPNLRTQKQSWRNQ